MTFSEVKENILFMENHPYMILRKTQTSCYGWWLALKKVLEFVEEHLEDEEDVKLQSCLNENLEANLQAGLMFLPAIMLTETNEKSWDIYSSIVLLIQNYANMIGNEELAEISSNLGNLAHMRNSWRALMIQCESLILQGQSLANSSSVPYNLSRSFITSLIGLDEKENTCDKED